MSSIKNQESIMESIKEFPVSKRILDQAIQVIRVNVTVNY